MGFAAMFTWLFAATFGAAMLAIWLIEHDGSPGATRQVPGPAVVAHMTFALAGFALWLTFLLSGWGAPGWGALGALGCAAALGSFMFARWVPAHRTWAIAPAGPGTAAGHDFPAEKSFPLVVVAAHGLCAVATVVLVVLTLT